MTKYDMGKAKAGDTFTKCAGCTDVYWKVVGVSFNGVVFADAFNMSNNSFLSFTTIEKRYGDGLWSNAVVYEPPVPKSRFYNVYFNSTGHANVSSDNDSMDSADRNAASSRKGVIVLTRTGDKVEVEYLDRSECGDV